MLLSLVLNSHHCCSLLLSRNVHGQGYGEVETQRYLSKYNYGFLWFSDHYGLVIFKHFKAAMLHIIFNLEKKINKYINKS